MSCICFLGRFLGDQLKGLHRKGRIAYKVIEREGLLWKCGEWGGEEDDVVNESPSDIKS